MALLDLYKKDIFRRVGKTADSFANDHADGFTLNKTVGSPTDYKLNKITPTQKTSDPVPDSTIRKMVEEYYENAPLLKATYLGRHAEPLVFIKPQESKDQYSNRFEYTNTRRAATADWLVSPKGVTFGLTQTALQLINPTLESKIYNPLSIFSNTIPLVDYHERRHATIDSLFGIPTGFLGTTPGSHTEAVWPAEYHSRNVNQSPFMAARIANESLPGLDYAFSGRDYMMNSSTWQRINPNRYLFPIGSDGAGLPISNRLTPIEEMNRNIGLAGQAYRFTQASGFNPVLDGQITMDAQGGGGSFLEKLLKNIPYADTILKIFGYGILGAKATDIKIYNSYNATYHYNEPNGKKIFIYNQKQKTTETYDWVVDNQSPIERMMWAIEQGVSVANEKAKNGLTFQNEENLKELARSTFETTDKTKIRDRVYINPQDGTSKTNSYMQAFGGIIQKREKDGTGTLDIDGLSGLAAVGSVKKPYTVYMKEMIDGAGDSEGNEPKNQSKRGLRIVHSLKGYGFARPGASNKEDRIGDQVNLLPYGEDYDVDPNDPESRGKDFTDLIPFKFYHVNEQKWIVFRASLTGITDSITPSWSDKKYIGRADKAWVYSGADRTINFSFSIYPFSVKELKPLYEKLNYLIGLNYPKYRNLSSRMGTYMEAPFVRLTIGDLFTNVPGILDGGLSITIPDETTWEVRQEHPQAVTDIDKIQVAKLPREIQISVNGFTPFGIDNLPISSTSPFYSAIKKWQDEGVNPDSNPQNETGAI